MPGIYLHIPFCRQACNYCDFYFSTSLLNKDAVIAALLKEIDLRHNYLPGEVINSIYFGGGTPSLLSGKDLQAVVWKLQSHFSWEKNIEITLEANPDDINTVSLKSWMDMGINRLSIGLQSFNDDELKWMNRAHTAAESISSVKLAQDMGFDNISIDLIYGSKYQTLASWEQTLNTAISLQSQHISSYNLTIENKTVLGMNYQKGKEPEVNDDLSSQQFLRMRELLEQTGFIQYEISNFGKPGYFAVHNSNYWRQQHYLGLGPSAHSFNGESRQWNVKNNNQYIKAIETKGIYFEKEDLSLKDRYNEYVLTRLRTIWGCDIQEIEKLFGSGIKEHFLKVVTPKMIFFSEKDGVYVLNSSGKLMADGLASDLFL